MSAKRPPAIKKKAFVEIDAKLLSETGEVKIIGEPIFAPEITTRVPKGKFEVVYCSELFEVMRDLGNKKIEVLAFILDHKDGNNQLNYTNTQLSKAIQVSRPTVIETLKVLECAGLITRKNSVIMVSPHLMVKGNQIREAYLMRKFEEMDEKELPYIESEIEGQFSLNSSGDIVQEVH